MLATDVLRERTARAHTALENTGFILPATRDRARLAALIGAMLSFHRAAEREIARHAPALAAYGIDSESYAKRGLLAIDARALASPDAAEPAFRLRSAAEAAGALYVLEGSTLGGVSIASDIRRHLAFDSAYYGCYGRETAPRWRATRERLNAAAASGLAPEEMAAGATYAFESLHAHLERNAPVTAR